MEINQLKPIPVIDCHIHYPHPSMMNGLMETCNGLKLDRLNIVCTPEPRRLSLVPDALHLKAQHPGRVYVFGGLDVSIYVREPQRVGASFANYIKLLTEVGCDGIKMIEGKPQMRKILPVPAFNNPVFDPYWQAMEETQIPLLMHLNDPEEFWDRNQVPKWAVQRGWFYGDGTYVNNEQQYREMIAVLERHPSLKVIFAHFFFLSAQLERLSELLDKYPNMNIDLTPGVEMFFNFSKNLQKTRDFFMKYQDRILFGTDIGARALLVNPEDGVQFDESRGRVLLVRNFLENAKTFTIPAKDGFLFGDQDIVLEGLDLPDDVLVKIYHLNFERIVAQTPKQVEYRLAAEFCGQIEKMIDLQGFTQPGVPGDASIAKMVGQFFRDAS